MDHVRPSRSSTAGATRRRRAVALVAAVLLLAGGLSAHLTSAPAAPTPPLRYAQWDELTGSSRDYTTTMRQRPTGFPAAVVQTNSVGGSGVGVQSGASAFLAAQTPPGASYGLSREQPYLNLRPNGLLTAPPSVTTYTFDRPTPATGWTFVLGDIDADEVQISATNDRNEPLSATELGFRSTFNYCAPGVSPKPSCAPPNNNGLDLPTWIPGDFTLRGNTGALDSAGASAWFEPTVAIKTLTFTYSQRSGSPVYQTWFAAQSHTVSGTIGRPDSFDDTVTVKLFDSEGNLVAQTMTGPQGRYAFRDLATYDNYRVQVVAPSGLTSDLPLSKVVDLSAGDATADFTLREIVPVPVSGTVTTTGNDPVAGVTVTLYDTDNTTVLGTTTTGADGSYAFDRVNVGDGYSVRMTVPDGYRSSSTRRDFDVPANSEEPISLDAFTLAPNPTAAISGRVTDNDGGPLGSITITVSSTGGDSYDVVTDADGNYSISGLPADTTYRVEVSPPDDGTEVVGTKFYEVGFTDAGGVVGDKNFRLKAPQPAPTYMIAGSVLDPDNEPVPGAVVEVTPPGGGESLTVTPDGQGNFELSGLPPADGYEVAVVPPEGYTAPAGQTIDLTEDDVNLSFVVTPTRASAPPSSSSPSSPPPSSPSAGSAAPTTASASAAPTTAPGAEEPSSTSSPAGVASGGLADTGGPSAIWLLAGLGAVVLGGLCLIGARVRSSGQRH